jgi:hypothetical protein
MEGFQMKPSKKIRKHLNRAKRELIRHGSINSPIFHITAGRDGQYNKRIHLEWHDVFEKVLAFNELKKFCQQVKAKEVVSIGDAYTYNKGKNSIIPGGEALIVSIETQDGIKRVILPYWLSPNGQIIFGENVKTFGFHAIRHLSASILFNLGYDLGVIQSILRHRSPSTTERYFKSIGMERVREALKSLSPRTDAAEVIAFEKAFVKD